MILLIIKLYIIGLIFLPACKSETPITKWENGVIPYYLKGNFSKNDLANLYQGMRIWESAAGVKFKEVKPRSSAYKIEKINENKWQSSIGENNSQCYMLFGNGDNALEHIVHEFGHTLGLLHEHQRPDRDQYIHIFWDNIQQVFLYNFEVRDNPLINEFQYAYDYSSVMHYTKAAFTHNGKDTLAAKNPSYTLKRQLISSIDADKAREIYGPPKD